jgi:eukaryotic-like serine/threonine-protein kinase
VIDARSDVFALGAVLYECLVGETPPPSKAVSWGPPSAPPTGSNPPPQMNSGVRPAVRTVPVAWRAFLSRAMALDPADRFADARTMAQALKDLSLTSLSSLPAAKQPEAADLFNESASSTGGTDQRKG